MFYYEALKPVKQCIMYIFSLRITYKAKLDIVIFYTQVTHETQ